MASNCPYWKDRKCAGTNNDYYHYCSLDSPEYKDCAVYKMIRIRAAGGSMLDMLTGADLLGKGPVMGSRRRLSDDELTRLTKKKKWWKFWK